MDKEYGKLTLPQFQRVVRELPELRSQAADFPSFLRSRSPEKLKALFSPGFYWAHLYELPFLNSIAALLHIFGYKDKIKEWSQEADPYQALRDALDREEGEIVDNRFGLADVICLVTVLQRNVLSIMLYHRPLSSLIKAVAEGDREALFKAVRVDRSIVACPTVAARIAQAELTDDKAFFLRLRSALKGPSKKHWESYKDLRYSLCILRECGLDNMSDAELEDLLVHKLKLYPNVPSARKNLRKQFNESKKFSTT